MHGDVPNDKIIPINPDLKKQILNDALKDFFQKHAKQEAVTDHVIKAGVDEYLQAWDTIKEVLAVAHTKGEPYNRNAAYQLAFTLLVERFAKWPKDDLIHIAAILHAEFLLDKADAFTDQLV